MDPARIIIRLISLLIIIACTVFCFPIVLILLLFLWFTGRLGLARNFVFTHTQFGQPPPRRESYEPHTDSDVIDAEVIEAETVMENERSADSQNRLR